MVDQTLSDLESRIKAARNLSQTQKKELQTLLDNLRAEVTDLSRTHGEDADSIADFVLVTASQGMKESQNPKLFQIAQEGIRTAVGKFENSHPALTLTVNGICTYFANLGI